MITVSICGHDSHHPKPCNIEHKKGLPDYLLLLVKKDCWCYLHGVKTLIPCNSILLFSPNTYIHYGCDVANYNDDWIHFSFSVQQEFHAFRELHIPEEQIITPFDFHALSEFTKMLSECFHSNSTCKADIINHLMYAFIYTLSDSLTKEMKQETSHRYYSDLSTLRTNIYNNPANDWDVNELASTVGLSLSYFQHLYKDFFASSFQQDIITARLSLARFYLLNSDMSIRNLAEFCGYQNELHFMRQFKKFVGVTPSEYRHSHL